MPDKYEQYARTLEATIEYNTLGVIDDDKIKDIIYKAITAYTPDELTGMLHFIRDEDLRKSIQNDLEVNEDLDRMAYELERQKG